MNSAPRIEYEVQPAKTVQQLSLADERLKNEMQAVKIPLLILHGTADKATRPEGNQAFYNKASSANKTLNLYEGHYHDLLNDLDKRL